MRRMLVSIAVTMLALGGSARMAGAVQPDSTSGRAAGDSLATAARGAIVTGAVFDSLRGSTLGGAVVQLVGLEEAQPFARAVVASADGEFAFADVPEGRYALGFFGSVLDSLGLEPPIRSVLVQGDSVVRADVAVPSAATLRAIVCRDPSGDAAPGGFALGQVRSASGLAALADAVVLGEWYEFTLDEDGFSRGVRTRTTRTRANGWYTLCDVPLSGELLLSAAAGSDSTDRIPIAIDESGVKRRDLYLGEVRYQRVAGAVGEADKLDDVDEPTFLRLGDGRLRGEVRTTIGAQPLAEAKAQIADGVTSTGDGRGAFTLTNAPMGTRLLDVRAVGYFPHRVAVDVIDSTPPVSVTLQSIKSVLDSVRVVAERNRSANMIGFDKRRASEPLGQFLTRADVLKRPTNFTADILATMRGVRITRGPDGREMLTMRQNLSRGRCQPSVFMDSVDMGTVAVALTLEEINAFVRKGDIQGIEVYPPGHVPARFQRFSTMGFAGCGAIVLWSRQ